MPYKDREQYLSSQKGYYQRNKEARKWSDIKSKYGITKEEFFNLLEDQDNTCKLCIKPFVSLRCTHVDHCHETNKIRGILCMPCNVALGMLGDNEQGLTRALEYVKGNL